MKMKMFLSVLLLIGFGGLAQADVILSGSSVEYNGAGQYTFEYYATAVGETHDIAGYDLSFDLSPGATYVANSFDSELSNQNIVPGQPPFAGEFIVSSAVGSILLQDGETGLLGSYVLDLNLNPADLPTTVAIPLSTGFDANFFRIVDNDSQVLNIQSFTGNTVTAPSVSPVPEPTSALLLVGGGLGLGALGLRRKARKEAATEEEQG